MSGLFLDAAVGPVLLVFGLLCLLLIAVVLMLVALAIVLIIRAVRKARKAKAEQDGSSSVSREGSGK